MSPQRLPGARLLAAALLLGLVAFLALDSAAQPPAGKSYALLVGVKDYEHSSLSPLSYTENDVEELAKVLDRPGSPFHGNVRVLTGTRGKKDPSLRPSAANIRKALEATLKDRTRNDTVLVALSGHGVQLSVKDPEGKKPERSFGFFCPDDAQLSGTNYVTGHHPRLLNVAGLMEQLEECGAGTKLVLMDACRNEVRSRALSFSPDRAPENTAILLSCARGEKSYEVEALKHGLFFHFVLEGLRGKAANKRDEVTWSGLGEYVTEQMSEEGKKLLGREGTQTPHLVASLKGKSPVLLRLDNEPKEIVNDFGMKLVRIPTPSKGFLMGAPPGEKEANADERPQHEVEITGPLYMGAYEVTQDQCENVTGKRYLGVTKGFPLGGPSYTDAEEFCKELTRKDTKKPAGWVYTLPTEAEWEYCCRAGTATRFHSGDSEDDLKKAAWYLGNSGSRLHPAGEKAGNAFGLFDMHGSVREWCSDRYDKDYYSKSVKKDPKGPATGDHRVLRGGCWLDGAGPCRAAARHGAPDAPGFSVNINGIRVALRPVPRTP